ncbi:basic amino acid ABC transporter substrate-binding protein [Biomaibacter acetigenes]|jgi:polar amino acid transport system substrate-binding protein|uniref:Basic amino acid ABC transporter substrate-binding protein n=2 Tax=Biomaibacter acetigenes TaxID=2316383 RepID=A0A3G2R9T0_9FIRM|nr:basic amino acid ABC transporter substrate-binding protein [Biomaibacter acetigenes]
MILSVLAGCGNKTASTEPKQDQNSQTNQGQSSQQGTDNSGQNTASEDDIIQKIKNSGKLVMATSADYPPYEFHDISGGKDEITGFDVDIARAIAKELGVQLEIKDMAFDGVLPALLAKKVDIAIAAFTITEERKKSVNFSEPYLDGGQQIVTYKGSGIKGKEDLKGKTIGVQLSTTGEAEAKKIEGAKLKQFDRVDAVMLDLMNKRVDAAIVGSVVADAYLKLNPDKFEKAGDKLNSEQNGIPVRKEDTKLLEVVNKVLKDLKDSGEYDKLVQKWFVDFKPVEKK